MDLNILPSAYTQIIYLTISPEHDLKDIDTKSGAIWSQALDAVEQTAAYQRLYWGRSVEQPEKVQLHIGRSLCIVLCSQDFLFLRDLPIGILIDISEH